MKKSLSVLIAIAVIISSFSICVFANGEIVQEAQIVKTEYAAQNAVVADIILTRAPYNADNTGNCDCSPILQKAIDDLYERGGGTVFLPKGEYKLCSSINIKPFVTVQGDWQDPDEGNDYGTVILALVESSQSSSPALFTVGGSAGAIGLTVFYPQQDINNVKPYPYTFYIDGLGANYMLHSIINCTLINSYAGIGACVKDGEGVNNAHEMTTVENVKGTCLKEGITFYNCADVDIFKSVYFSPKYWSEAGEKYNAASYSALSAYTKQNLTAFTLGDLEWPEFCDLKADSCLYGIHFVKGPRASFSGTFYDISFTNCQNGILADEGSIMERGAQWGYSIANSSIEGENYALNDYTGGVVMLCNTKCKGKVEGENIHKEAASTSNYKLDYNYSYPLPKDELYIVNADKSGKTDISSPLQEALDECGSNGGGIVYLPAGLYRLDNPVTVPSGVELRGAGQVATRCQTGLSAGTLIISYYGYLDENPTSLPLITLSGDNSGLFAIRINHVKNSIKDDSGSFKETSPAVLARGNGCHIINCFSILSSVCFEFENCENAYIKRCCGVGFDNFIKMTNCKNSLIEGCLQNANTLPRNGYSSFDIPEFSDWLVESNLFAYCFIPIYRIYTDFLNISNSSSITVFNTFIYGGRRFLKEENSDIFLCNVGSDGQSDLYSSYFLNGGNIAVIGTMHSSSYGFNPKLTYEIQNKAKLKMYNRVAVDVTYNMYTRFENLSLLDIKFKDLFTFIFQPITRYRENKGLSENAEMILG